MATLSELLKPFVADRRIGSRHVCVFLALLQCSEGHSGDKPFYIHRQEVMRLGKIQGLTTYYRVMRELDHWGYIEYWPSHHSDGRTKVFLHRFPWSSYF